MPTNRFYVDTPLNKSQNVLIKDTEHYHLKNVMRNRSGDTIEIINGKDILATALIDEIDRHQTSTTIQTVVTHKPHYPLFHLVLGLAHPSKLEMAVEKCTELGASNFTIVAMEKSKKQHLSTKDHTRLTQIIIGATKQCGRLDMPKLQVIDSLEALEIPNEYEAVFFGDIEAPDIELPSKAQSSLFFIGPESGFGNSDLDLIKKRFKAQGKLLHRHILRFETACIVATTNYLLPI